MAFKLKQKLVTDLQAAIEALSSAVAELRDEYDNHTERWQDSDKGQSVGQWIEVLEDQLDELESVADNIELAPEA